MDSICSKLYTNHINYWKEYPNPQYIYLKNKLNEEYSYRDIHLWISLFIKPGRETELLTCLELNLSNKFIKTVTVILEESNLPERIIAHPKLRVIRKTSKWRTKYNDILDEIDENSNEINIIANNDILLSHKNLDFLFRLTPKDLAVLSRWEVNKPYSKDIEYYEKNSRLINNIASSDVWIFVEKPNIETDIYLGIPGCENMFINEFYNQNYNIVNLGNIIKSYHLHENHNLKQSYPFTYYFSSLYKLTFVDFYNELVTTTNTSLNSLYEINNYTDYYSKLSIIFSSFWNMSFEKDLKKIDDIIEEESKNIRENLIKIEGPKIKQDILNEEMINLQETIDREYEEKQKVLDSLLEEHRYLNHKQINKICEEIKCKEIEKINIEIEELCKTLKEQQLAKTRVEIDQEIAKRKLEAEQEISKFENEYKSQIEKKFIEEINLHREQRLLQVEKECSDFCTRKTNELNIKLSQIEKEVIQSIESKKQELLEEYHNLKINTQEKINKQTSILEEKTKLYETKRYELDSMITESQIEFDNKVIEYANKLIKVTNEFDEKKKLLEQNLKEFQNEITKKQEEEKSKLQQIINETTKQHEQKITELQYEYNKKVKEESLNLNNFFFSEKKKIDDDLNNIRNTKIEEINADILLKQNEFNSLEGMVAKLITDFRNKEDELRKREFQIKDEIDKMDEIRAQKLKEINIEYNDKIKSETEKLNSYLFEQRNNIEAQLTEIYTKKLEEMTKNIKEKEEFYEKYFEEKDKLKQNIDKKLQESTEKYNEKIKEYNSQVLETESKLASVESIRRRKFLQLEIDCKQYEDSERERISMEARVLFEKLHEENRIKAFEEDEVERTRLKQERERENAAEIEKLKKKLIEEIEHETNTKKKEYSDELNTFYRSEEEKLIENFDNKKVNIQKEFEDIHNFNNNVNIESVKKFINDFSNTRNKEYSNLHAEIESTRLMMLNEINEQLNNYKINKKHEIDNECFSLKSSNIKELEDDIKTLRNSKIQDIEKECNEIKTKKLNEVYEEISVERDKHRKIMIDHEIALEKQRIMTHNDKVKALETEFSSKLSDMNKLHSQTIEEMKQDLVNKREKINEKLNEEIELLKKHQDKEFNEYKQKLVEETQIEKKKLDDELKEYKEVLTTRIMDEHENERIILRQQREAEHNNEIALLVQSVSKVVSEREREMTFNMMNELLKKRDKEEKQIETEVNKYKEDLINKAEASIKELTVIQELLNKSNIETEEKRIELFKQSEQMCIDKLNELENKRILEIENDLTKRMNEIEDSIRQKQLENNIKEEQRMVSLRKTNETKLDEYRRNKLKTIDKEILDDVTRQKNKLLKEFTDTQAKENERLKQERTKYNEEQRGIINDRINAEYEFKLEEVLVKIRQEEENRMKKLNTLMEERDKKDIDTRNEKMRLYVLELNTMIEDERKKIEEEKQVMLKTLKNKEREILDEKERADKFLVKVKQEATSLLAAANEQKRKIMSQLDEERIRLETEIQNLKINFEEEKTKALKKIIEAQKRAAELINDALG